MVHDAADILGILINALTLSGIPFGRNEATDAYS